MEKKQAQDYIKEVLNSRFDLEQFELFVRNLLNEFEPRGNSYSGNLIPEAFRDHIAHYKRIGKYTDPEGEPMDILIVQTRSVNKLERTRTALRNFVVRHLKNFDKYYALVAFYSKEDDGREWRLSLVKIDIETERTEQGKIKTKEEIVPAKRFSYLVGEYESAHTAQKQLLPLLVNDHSNPLIIKEKDGDGSVEGAFSIEKVTDEFYEQYKELYLKLTESAVLTETLKKEGLDPVRFVKKLLGQIVFLYFLQKKGWLGVPKDQKMGEGPKNFLRQQFDEITEAGGDYFNDFLRYLFYEALAKEHYDEGIKYYNKRLDCKIPFLNGGLFEADYENWETLDLDIDNALFSNPDEKTKGGDKGTGILDVFDRYNFTIREDEPLEKEVAVDPEMLGKVFENLLEVTDRKSKGAFYTPREIVHYMCQESLIHYLDNTVNNYTESYQPIDSDQTSLFGGSANKKGNLKIELENKGNIQVPKEDIEQMIRKGHLVLEHETTVTEKGKETRDYSYRLPESIRKHAKVLDQALADIKICDPAIGSGAFPVGMLNEIVTARKVLVPYLDKNYIGTLQKQSGIADGDTMPSDYYFKRHAIQESIYGVDIDASAIDIARLRLWLSMIVDEEDYETIDALPNLDYKIVCGNSLIGSPDNAMRDLNIEAELEKLKKEFFHETDENKKKALRQKIDQKIRQLLDSAETFAGYEIYFDFKLFFSEVWHYKNGFDVVIGNPPYGAKLTSEEKQFFKREYLDVHMRTPDSFNYFISKGLRLLHLNGVVSFIVPNNLFFQNEFEKTRRVLLTSNHIHFAINLGDGVFNTATVPSCIFLSSKGPNGKDSYGYADLRNINKQDLDFRAIFKTATKTSTLKAPACILGITETESKIIDLLRTNSMTIDDIAEEMASGISTGGDKIFRVTYDFAKSNNLEQALLKPVLVGGEIDKYFIKNTNHLIIYTDRSTDISKYPNIESYLETFKEKLKNRSEAKRGIMPWFALNRQRYPLLFEEDKIILRQTSDRIRATLDLKKFYAIDSILVFKKKKELNIDYKYILGIINSEVSHFLYSKFTQETGRTFAQVKPINVRKLFIPECPNNEQTIVIKVVEYLLALNRLEHSKSIVSKFYEEVLDAVCFNIFLKNPIKLASKSFFTHLNDLKPVSDEMSEEEKLAIIQSEFERLYDPNHPVRNNLETLDSVEEVRIIKEALK